MTWTEEKFGNILKRVERFEQRDSKKTYQFSGTYSFGKGVFLNQLKRGNEFALEYVQRIKKNDFVYCKIMAWEGGFGVVPKQCDNTVMSGAFVAYEIDETKVVPQFLDYYFKLERIWKNIGKKSTGTNLRRRSLHPDDFENNSLLLPSLAIQKTIVKRLDAIYNGLQQIKNLKKEQEIYFAALRNSIFNELLQQEETRPIDEILIKHFEETEIEKSNYYKQVTVRLNHEGVGLRKLVKGSEVGSTQNLAKAGNFIISKIDARNGAMGFIPEDLDGAIVTNDFPLFDFTEDVNPKFFAYFCNTNYFDEACKKASEGTTNRVRLKMDKFYNIQMPKIEKERQDEIVEMLDKVYQIKQHQKLLDVELKALFPSILDKAFKGEW